jgi:CheY-like chemotaxis protein
VDADGPKPVLVVDDDPTCCQVMAEMLAVGGFRAEWTTDAGSAVERVRGGGYALVVCDLQMPEMPGTELAAAIGTRYPGVPLLLVSAHPDARARADARALGLELLAKPFLAEVFLGTVRRLCAVAAERLTP